MTVESSHSEIAPIQMLRAVAALLVVLVHVDQQLDAMGYRPLGFGWGARGVDIFFVISGFIMWVAMERRPETNAFEFIGRRLRRIVPLYWATTAFVVGIALVAPALLNTTRLEPWHMVASFLFLPAPHPANGAYWPVVVPGWSLNFEMLFYMLFAVAIANSRGSPRRRLAWLAGLIVAANLAAAAMTPLVPSLSFYTGLLMFEFIAGVLLAAAFVGLKVPRGPLWYAALVGGFALLWRFGAGDVAGLVGSLIIVAAALFAPVPKLAPLIRLGDASYSLYLSQVLSLPAAALAYRAMGLDEGPAWRFVVLALVFAIAGALAGYHLFERPVDRIIGRLTGRRRSETRYNARSGRP